MKIWQAADLPDVQILFWGHKKHEKIREYYAPKKCNSYLSTDRKEKAIVLEAVAERLQIRPAT